MNTRNIIPGKLSMQPTERGGGVYCNTREVRFTASESKWNYIQSENFSYGSTGLFFSGPYCRKQIYLTTQSLLTLRWRKVQIPFLFQKETQLKLRVWWRKPTVNRFSSKTLLLWQLTEFFSDSSLPAAPEPAHSLSFSHS